MKKAGELIKKSNIEKSTSNQPLSNTKKSSAIKIKEQKLKVTQGFKFIVNGTQILIDSSAKRVSIGKNQIEVDF